MKLQISSEILELCQELDYSLPELVNSNKITKEEFQALETFTHILKHAKHYNVESIRYDPTYITFVQNELIYFMETDKLLQTDYLSCFRNNIKTNGDYNLIELMESLLLYTSKILHFDSRKNNNDDLVAPSILKIIDLPLYEELLNI